VTFQREYRGGKEGAKRGLSLLAPSLPSLYHLVTQNTCKLNSVDLFLEKYCNYIVISFNQENSVKIPIC